MSQTLQAPSLGAEDVQELIQTRRDLHQHPELGYEEVRTSGIVQERLRSLGVPFRSGVGKTGVVGLLGRGAQGGEPGRVVMLRADMDALPIQEQNEVPYRSTVDGKMHACGHDCHTSTLLTVARALKREEASLAGTVKLCFQPAEEGGAGADRMIADGVLDNPKPAAAFGYHVWQDLDLGMVGVPVGPWMAAVDEFTITLHGRGAHAAQPQEGLDPLLAASHVVAALQSVVSRNSDPFLPAVVSVTQFKAGSAFNIIPDSVWLNGTVRIMDQSLWEVLPGHFERVVSHVAQAFGCTAEIQYERMHRTTDNDPAMSDLVYGVACEVVGQERVRRDIRTMGGEDFSAFLHRVPGAFFAVGSRNESRGLVHAHHHPRFDVDEKAMEIAAEILLRLSRKYLQA